MSSPKYNGIIFSLSARKRFGSTWGLKVPYFHPEEEPYRHPQGGGKVYRIRFGEQETYDYVQQDNPRHEDQQAWRKFFDEGVIAAKALTIEERAPYAARAKKTKMGSWFNVFMSDWLLA